jgi:transglutaminase-like putative cysteine protease
MPFALVHRMLLDALGALGLLALLADGGVKRADAVVLAIGLAVALALPEAWRARLGALHAALWGSAAAAGSWMACGRWGVDLALALLGAAQVVRMATRSGARHDLHVLALALVHLLTAIVLRGGVGTGVAFFGLAVIAPAALTLSQLRREVEANHRQGARDRSELPVDLARILRSRRVVGRAFVATLCFLSVPASLLALSLASLAPRLDAPWLTVRGGALAPSLAAVDPDRNGAVVLRVVPPPGPRPERRTLHLRESDFRGWPRAGGAEAWSIEPTPSLRLLYLPEGTVAVERGRGSYRAFTGAVTPSVLTPAERARHLALPGDRPERVGALARTWTDGLTDRRSQARAIEDRLARGDYRHDLAAPSSAAPQPLDHFLFESKRGHCTYFANAMVLLLRELEIPARTVSGFGAGSWNDVGGFYAVRASDAHAWVEAHFDDEGAGWVAFDPTPPAPAASPPEPLARMRDVYDAAERRWDAHIVTFDAHTLAWLAACLSAAALIAWFARRPGGRPKPAREASLYVALDDAMARAGVARASGTPPLRHAEELAARGHPLAAEVAALTERYLEARFGRRAFTAEEHAAFCARVRRLS